MIIITQHITANNKGIDHNPTIPINTIVNNKDIRKFNIISNLDNTNTTNKKDVDNSNDDIAYDLDTKSSFFESTNILSTNKYSYRPLTARIPYPHIALGSFAKSFRDYIHYSVYDGFQGIIFGAYNKSIQAYLQRKRYSDDNGNDGPVDFGLPIFSYTMQIDGTDEKLDLPWRSSTFFPGMARAVYPSFYEDDDFELKIVYRRLKGSITANIYCSSEAELLDIEMAFFDGFRGLNVFNQTNISAMTILPDNILFNDVNGNRISRILKSDNITKSFIPAINNTKYYIPNNISAIINMSSLSHQSSYYGASALPEYNLSGTFNFEIEIPQYILCMAKPDFIGIEIGIDIAYKYESNKVANAIRYITGDPIDTDDHDKEILTFTNGQIIDKRAFNISKDYFTDNEKIKIPIDIIFDNKDENKVRWNYKNRDIMMILVYSGGVLRVPFDNEVIQYDEQGNILIEDRLMNIDDFVELYVFKFNKDFDR